MGMVVAGLEGCCGGALVLVCCGVVLWDVWFAEVLEVMTELRRGRKRQIVMGRRTMFHGDGRDAKRLIMSVFVFSVAFPGFICGAGTFAGRGDLCLWSVVASVDGSATRCAFRGREAGGTSVRRLVRGVAPAGGRG